jgi:putative zinc finger/helix-turn-helix YgiT family protein
MTCIHCRKAELKRQKTDMPAELKGEPVLVPQIDALVCPRCGYKTLHGSRMSEYMHAAADAYRRKKQLLTSQEIRSRREQLRMTQDQFASYLGVGSASVKRWELGQVQDRAMDRLIRIMTDPAEALRNYQHVRALTEPLRISAYATFPSPWIGAVEIRSAIYHEPAVKYSNWQPARVSSDYALKC